MLQNAGKQLTIDHIKSTPESSWTERWGCNFSFLSTACGVNPKNPGQIGVFDLAYDPSEVFGRTIEELVGLLNSNEKIIRVISANKQPIIFPAKMAPKNTKALEIPENERARHDAQALLR
jgi:hypothetical protein